MHIQCALNTFGKSMKPCLALPSLCKEERKMYSFLSLLIYCYLFQSTIRVLNIDKLINYARGNHEISISLSYNLNIFLIYLKILLLLVQNLGGSHPTHATIYTSTQINPNFTIMLPYLQCFKNRFNNYNCFIYAYLY